MPSDALAAIVKLLIHTAHNNVITHGTDSVYLGYV